MRSKKHQGRPPHSGRGEVLDSGVPSANLEAAIREAYRRGCQDDDGPAVVLPPNNAFVDLSELIEEDKAAEGPEPHWKMPWEGELEPHGCAAMATLFDGETVCANCAAPIVWSSLAERWVDAA